VIVVLGASGQVGTAFTTVIPDATFLTRADLDLATTTPEQVARLFTDLRPSLVVNCAAYTAVDRAEEEPELATRVNGEAVGWLAAGAAEAGARFVTYSTDYVFAGTGTRPYLESDPVDPVNAYGRSKLAGERAALDAGGEALVVRTSWVISATHPNFVATMLRRAAAGQPSRVVDDQRGCPTVAADLARATLDAVEAGASGLLHLTNQGETTWYRLASAAVEQAGLDPGLVTPCPTSDYPTPARRPAYSVLGSERRSGFGLAPIPEWHLSLPAVVSGLVAVYGL
jgi:dTDP-4-dehydrorhamnose reductase